MPILSELPQHIYLFAAILGTLTLSFLVFFLLPGLRISFELSRVIKQLQVFRGKADRASLKKLFDANQNYRHLWQEYSDSLHDQRNSDTPDIRVRSTLPANFVFNQEVLVETPLHTDFFKHLPGLFTGIGIIGTFYGLLIGLQAFEVSENPLIVRNSLNHLLHGVWEAFLVSAVAITLAMLVTFTEKLLTSRLNAKVERLCQLLDGLFEGGASEEYLARLVEATEASQTQDMRSLLSELLDKQMVAAQTNQARLGDRIVAGLQAELRAPLAEIASALKQARAEDNAAMQELLSSVLNRFAQQMKELFGNQFGGINTLQQQTVQSLQTAIAALQEMAASMQRNSEQSHSTLTTQLAATLAEAETRQRSMNDKLSEFVDQMRTLLSDSHGANEQAMQQTLQEISDRTNLIISELGAQVRQANESSQQHQTEVARHSQQLVGQFGEQIGSLTDGINRTISEMKTTVLALRNITTESFSKLNNGADTLYLAAKDFAKAGQSVGQTLERSENLTAQLTQAAGAVASASNGLNDVVADYRKSRDGMTELVSALQAIMEQVKREAALSSAVIDRIEAATGKLIEAQKQADQYLGKVSEVLGNSHQAFSAGLTKTVGEANREFHQALADSVRLLREGIQELEDTLSAVSG